MPAETAAVQVDVKILTQAAAWSLRYLVDPQRGRSKSLPSDSQLQSQFPNSNLKIKDIEIWLYNKFGSMDLAKIAQDQLKIQEVLTEIEGQKKVPETAAVPHITPSGPEALPRTRGPQEPEVRSGGHVSALGVLAELESVEPILERHRQEAAAKLSSSLEQKLKTVLPSLKVKGLSQDQIATVVQEIATETSQESLENVAKIQDLSQINQVVADSLTQSILAYPQLSGLKIKEEKLYGQIFEQTQDIAKTHQQDLETAAVLGNLTQIAELKKPNQQVLELISEQVEQTIETQAPLTPPNERSLLKGSLGAYLSTFPGILEKELSESLSQGKIPSFDQLQKAKEKANNQAIAQIATNLAKSREGKSIETRVGLKPLTDHFGGILGLKPISQNQAEILGLGRALPKSTTFARSAGLGGFGVGLILNAPARQQEAYSSLLAYNKPKLTKTIEQFRKRIQWFQNQKSLSFRQKKEFLTVQKQLENLRRSQEFPLKQPKRYKTYLAYFQSLPIGKRLGWASGTAWNTTEAFSGQYRGVFVPRSAVNPTILAGRSFGSLSFGLGNFHAGLPQPPTLGMGRTLSAKASIGFVAAGIATGIMGRIIKGSAVVFGGLFLWALGAGQAAATGFVIGAAVGGTVGTAVGAYLGFQIGVALAPFTFGLSIPVFTFLGGVAGGFMGGSVGGVVGALIGLGLYSGSATLVSTGVGAGIGGTIGGWAGFSVGSAISAGLTALFPPLAILSPVIIFTSTAIGVAIGTLAGAYIGYLFGNYVLPAITNLFDALGSAFSGTAGAGASALGAIGSFFTGLASGIWGGITGTAGTAFGFLSSATNFIVGGLSSLSIPASAAAIPVVGGISAVAVGSTIVGIVTATAFSVAETDQATPGENQYVSVQKLASVPDLSISPNATIQFPYEKLPRTIQFDVSIKAKTGLTDVVCSEKTTLTKKDGTSEGLSLSPAPPCPKDFSKDQEFTFSQTITIPKELKYEDSQIINTFSVSGTSDSTNFNVSATATVSIGNPPQCAPNAVPIKDPWKLTSEFGSGHPLGVDIADSTDRQIFSTFPCTTTVIYAGWLDPRGSDGYGYAVILQSGRYETISGHMNNITVSIGDRIPPYGEIGPLGSTGLSSGPHIHYEVHVDGAIVNPHDYGIPYKPLDQY